MPFPFLHKKRDYSANRSDSDDDINVWIPKHDDDAFLRLADEHSTSLNSSRHSVDSLSTSSIHTHFPRIEWLDGGVPAMYSGELNESNLPHGKGDSIMENGHVYSGMWINGSRHSGSYRWPSGARYQGEFRDNVFHGIGSYTWADGDSYRGSWVQGFFHGHGQRKDTDYTYIGSYKFGIRHGQGKMIRTQDGSTFHEGEWKKGEPVTQKQQDTEVVRSIIKNDTTFPSPASFKFGSDGRMVELDLCNLDLKLTRLTPQDIVKLTELRSLDLSGCSMTNLPHETGSLVNLRKLRLNNCQNLGELPRDIGSLSHLVELSLNDCDALKTLPREIGELSQLTVLSMSGCRNLRELPSEIGLLSKLSVLTLGGCDNLRRVPKAIQDLSRRNNIELPRRLNRDFDYVSFVRASRRRLAWSGPGGLRRTKKRRKDKAIVQQAINRMEPKTLGGIIDIVDYNRNSTRSTKVTASSNDVRIMLDHKKHRERWDRLLDEIIGARDRLRHDVVEKKATELLQDTTVTLRKMDCHMSAYFPTCNTIAFYCRSLARAKSDTWQGAVDDATECLKLIQIERRDDIARQRHLLRPDLRIIMLRTRGIALERLGHLDEAILDYRACCAAIRLVGDRWNLWPTMEEAVTDLLYAKVLLNIQRGNSRPHYTRKERRSTEKELGLRIYQESRYRCLYCGTMPSDTIKLKRCEGCHGNWFCSTHCKEGASREGYKNICSKARKNLKFISLPHSKKRSLREGLARNECVVEVFDDTFICVLRDSRTGRCFDSLSDKDVSFHKHTALDDSTESHPELPFKDPSISERSVFSEADFLRKTKRKRRKRFLFKDPNLISANNAPQ